MLGIALANYAGDLANGVCRFRIAHNRGNLVRNGLAADRAGVHGRFAASNRIRTAVAAGIAASAAVRARKRCTHGIALFIRRDGKDLLRAHQQQTEEQTHQAQHSRRNEDIHNRHPSSLLSRLSRRSP